MGDEGPWYEKIGAGKNLQTEELTRFHLNIKVLLDRIHFPEQEVSTQICSITSRC